MTYCGYFQARGKILCGIGQVKEVGSEIITAGYEKVIVVTDEVLIKAGTLSTLLSSLDQAKVQYQIYDQVKSDPTVIMMDEIARQAQAYGAQAFIGAGGGSALDAAKGAAVVMANGGSIRDYVGENKFSIPPTPVFAIPTTAGTGSEVSWHISVNDTERELKVTVRSPLCVPEVAVLDASLMSTVPKSVAAFTGMDAFTHSFESYISTKGSWPLTETLALKSMQLIAENLRPFVANPANLAAGQNMLIAAMMGGMCLSHARTGIVHQMARPLGAVFHVPHGLANSILLPYTMSFTVQANPEKFAQVAAVMGLNVQGLATMDAARLAITAVDTLCQDISIPRRLQDVGVTADKIVQLAEDAMQGKPYFDNPCRGEIKDLINIYEASF